MNLHPVFRLGDVADVVAGDPAPQDTEAFSPDGPLFVRMQDVGRDHVNPALRTSADRLHADWLRRNRLRLFPRDSVLIPKSGASVNLNHRAKLSTDAYVVSHLAIIIPDRARIDPDYLFWWSVLYDPREQVQVTSLPSLKLSTLKKAKIPVPSLDEQRRIVDILNRASRIEHLRAEFHELFQNLASAMFINMFGNVEDNPMGWPIYPFTDLVADETRGARKIPKKNYEKQGRIPIIDQGKMLEPGYTNDLDGCFRGPLPAIIFGDHTRNFVLAERPFFLGADGAKILVPKIKQVDPVFLFAHLQCLRIEDAGYSRHFKYLKRKYLMLPPLDKQRQFRSILKIVHGIASSDRMAVETVSSLNVSLMAHLLEGYP